MGLFVNVGKISPMARKDLLSFRAAMKAKNGPARHETSWPLYRNSKAEHWALPTSVRKRRQEVSHTRN